MKKVLLSFLVIFSVIFSANAQIKNYVGIVRQQYHEDTITMLNEFKDDLKKDGYSTFSKAISAYIEGGFGSGFVYVDSKGDNYIITNLHVVSQAATCSVEFENQDGTYTKYENLTVLSVDEDLDLAILKFNDSKPFTKGLSFSAKSVTDGMDVWSAGFPGLGNNPMWQLGKGVVTNSTARIKELIDPDVTTLIQHSAQIDSGNSGGPLMVVSANSVAGYEVIGINTWKAAYRQETNYSIPASTVKKFIEESLNPKVVDSETLLKQRIESLIEQLDEDDATYSDIVNYVAYESVAQAGIESLLKVNKSAPTAVRSNVINTFSYSPIEGIRLAVAYETWKKFNISDVEYEIEVDSIEKNKDENFDVVFVFNGEDKTLKTLKTTWVSEHGKWRMDYSSKVLKEEKIKQEKESELEFSLLTDTYTTFSVNFDMPTKDSPFSSGWGGSFMHYTSFISYGVKFISQNLTYEVKDYDEYLYEDIYTIKTENFFTTEVFADIHVGFKLNDFVLIPYGKVSYAASLCFDTFNFISAYGLGGGLRVGYFFDSIFVYLDASYDTLKAFEFSTVQTDKQSFGLAIGIGI